MKGEALAQLQQIIGKNAELFERVVRLLEKNDFPNKNAIGWHRNDFEKLTLLLLKRLETALEQVENLLKAEIITSQEFEESALLLNGLRNEAKELFFALIIGYPEKNENPVEQSEIEELLAVAKKRVA